MGLGGSGYAPCKTRAMGGQKDVRGNAVSHVVTWGRVASDFLPGDEFDVTTRMQKRVTEIDGRKSERVVFLVCGQPTGINSQQLSSPGDPALFPETTGFALTRFNLPLINFTSRRRRSPARGCQLPRGCGRPILFYSFLRQFRIRSYGRRAVQE